jgi:hypothetical protein
MATIAQIVCASRVVFSAFVTIGLVLSRLSVVVPVQAARSPSPAARVDRATTAIGRTAFGSSGDG